MSNISKERIDFGAIPNQSAIDLDSSQKIGDKRKQIKKYKDMIMLLNFLIGVTFMLRERDEHKELCWSNFKFSTL